MAYDSEKKKYSKEHFWYVEIVVNGVTYRFCENRSPLPLGLKATPSLQSVRVNPAEIDLSGGIGVRAKCSLSLMESDDHTIWGTVKQPVRFWSRWRAENPYYLGQRISVYSGYIYNGLFRPEDFIRRDYIIESFAQSGAGVSITGKDPLKLASNNRAKAPIESRGSLLNDIISTDTSITLQPAGIGDSEYPASNFYVRVGDEVMLCTSRTGDVLTVTRGAYNTQADDHSEDDVAQLCLEYNLETVSNIDYDLLVNYANVDPSYINKAEWDSEVSNSFITTYSTLITEPTGVQDLLREFSESAPHYLYWDERVNRIRLTSLRPPPSDAFLLTYEKNLIDGSTAVKDMQDMRVSTVICNYGIIDPTKDLDEVSNYRASYVREDSSSVTNYGQRAYKKINSRWINSDNKTAAVLMSARIGRRFSDAPRMLSFDLDAKDSDVWTGDSIRCQTDLIEQAGGGYPFLFYQVLTAGESANFNYTALEHTYGDAVPGDEDVEDPNVRLIYISGEQNRLQRLTDGTLRSLRDLFADVFPADHAALDPNLDIRFIFESNAVCGSSEVSAAGVETGAWPELITPILVVNNGLIIGKGGDATANNGGNGGVALSLQADIRLRNLNTIGGGGGAGGSSEGADSVGDSDNFAGGGGGAGYFVGLGFRSFGNPFSFNGENGTFTKGGEGGDTATADGGKGGDLGQNGQSGMGDIVYLGGQAGKAIDLNGFTITYEETGTILGDVS